MVVALVWAWVSISTLPTIAAGAESGVRPEAIPVAGILSSRNDPTDADREVSRPVAARAVGNSFAYGRISAAHGGAIDTSLRAGSLAVITANFGRASPGELASDAGTTSPRSFIATEAGTPLYRGVATDHHAYDDAVKGIARPGDVNGVSDAALHNAGFTHGTDLTSWSTKLNVAEDFAGPGGVVLETSVEQLQRRGVQILTSPDNFDEAEVLVRGTVCGLATRRC